MTDSTLDIYALGDAAIKIRTRPYTGKYAGKLPQLLGMMIEGWREMRKYGRVSIDYSYSNGHRQQLDLTAPLMEYSSWIGMVDELLVACAGLDHLSLPDASWRSYYDDELNPMEAIETMLEDDPYCMPSELAMLVRVVVGEPLPVGTHLHKLVELAQKKYNELSLWEDALCWLHAELTGYNYLSKENTEIYARLHKANVQRFYDDRCPAEALGWYFLGEFATQRLSARKTALYLNAIDAAQFDLPGLDGNILDDYRRFTESELRKIQGFLPQPRLS